MKPIATGLDIPAGIELYINVYMCRYYRRLWNKTKKLWIIIFSYFTVSITIRLRLQEKRAYNIITRIDDLEELLADEGFTIF